MNSEEARKKMEWLVNEINKWNHEYFDLNNPSVSDRVYDSHLKMLIELEEKFPNIILKNSPTQKIGANAKEYFKKIKHKKQMLSLNKAYSIEELNKFINDIYKVINSNNFDFFIEPKIDGLSISLHYKNGILVQAITRGDGNIGEDVSKNVINIIKDIPVQINYLNDLEVRGEIFISKSMFHKINDAENTNYANPRNLAAGTLRQLNSSIVRKRNLSSFIYDLVDPEKHNLFTQENIIAFLEQNKFNVFQDKKNVKNIEEIQEFITKFNDKKDQLDYEVDGIVIKLNQIEYYELIGYTTKFPKFMIAYKFDDEIVNTTLENIFITIGRTGIVTYNAKFKPVLLKGTMVSAATLHNYNYIKEIGLNIGDEISIKKAGEIIPKVLSVVNKKSVGIFNKILVCPYCSSLLIDTQTQNNQICPNNNCSEIIIKKIVHFASREAMNIEGLAEGIVRKFFELNILNSIEQIFHLHIHKELIIKQKRFGPKFWENLNNSIEESKNASLEKVIFALGINQLGAKTAKQIAEHIVQFEKIKSIDFDELNKIKDIGPITIKEIKDYLMDKNNIKLIDFLLSININPKIEIKQNLNTNNMFYNKTIVISGTFSAPRSEIISFLENQGAKIVSSISKATHFLLVGENPGSKFEKAKKLGIRIIEKDEFEALTK